MIMGNKLSVGFSKAERAGRQHPTPNERGMRINRQYQPPALNLVSGTSLQANCRKDL